MKKIFLFGLLISFTLLVSCQPVSNNVGVTGTPADAVTNTPDNDESPDLATDTPVSPSPPPPISAPDLSNETITIYQIADTTSALAGIRTPEINGAADAVAQINQQDGIFGADLILKHYETSGETEKALEAYEAIKQSDDNPLLILIYDAWVADLLSPLAKEDGIVLMTTAPSETAVYGTPDSTTFAMGPTYSDQLVWFGEFLNANWETIQPDETGSIKLAIIGWPAPFGLNSLNDDAASFLESIGIEIVFTGEMHYSYTADATNLILEARAAGANVIYSDMYAFGTAQILNDLQWLVLRDNLLIIGSTHAFDISMYGFLIKPENAYSSYLPFYSTWWDDTDNPGIQQALDNFNLNDRSLGEKNTGRLIAQASIDVIKHTLENALLVTDLENLNSLDIYDQLVQLENYSAGNGIMAVSFSPSQRSLSLIHLRSVGTEVGEYFDTGYSAEVPDWRPSE